MNNRHVYKVWSLVAASDVEGCLALKDPKTLTWQLPLSNTNVLVLCLLDKLAALGYVPRSETLVHAPLRGLYYDDRNAGSRRSYLQAVLASADLFARGQRRFRSDQPASYYALLLRSRGRLEERLSGEECLARVA
jgi:hypothetical protein